MARMTLPERKATSCQNCGHGHHDGSLWIEVRDYGTDDEPYQIKACNNCTCSECSAKAAERLKNENK